jgi:hypothetical protein
MKYDLQIHPLQQAKTNSLPYKVKYSSFLKLITMINHERPRESEDDLCRVHRPSNQQRRAVLGWRDTEDGKRPELMEESR